MPESAPYRGTANDDTIDIEALLKGDCADEESPADELCWVNIKAWCNYRASCTKTPLLYRPVEETVELEPRTIDPDLASLGLAKAYSHVMNKIYPNPSAIDTWAIINFQKHFPFEENPSLIGDLSVVQRVYYPCSNQATEVELCDRAKVLLRDTYSVILCNTLGVEHAEQCERLDKKYLHYPRAFDATCR